MTEADILSKAKERREAIKAAAEALSDLNTFAIVVSVLEDGHLHSPSYDKAEKIRSYIPD